MATPMNSASLVEIPVNLNGGVTPDPRSGHCMALVNYCMYVWGGHTQLLFEGELEGELYPVDETLPNTDDHFIDVYDILNYTWDRCSTSGDVPDLGNGSTLVAHNHYLYLFGGWNEGDFSSDMYRFDTHANSWERIQLSDDKLPSPRYLTAAVLYCDKIYYFGGVGGPVASIQHGANYIEFQQHDHSYGFGWNNEMFAFDTFHRCWKDARIEGSRPPPSAGFTMNMIDAHRALLFAGRQQNERVSYIYIYNFLSTCWSAAFTATVPEQPWPVGRTFHTASCLVDPDYVACGEGLVAQKLLVLWGKGDDNKHCQDSWLLDVKSMTWSEFAVDVKPRMWHKACVYHAEGTRSKVVLLGGNIRRSSGSERHVVTGLTVLSFGVLRLKQLCLESARIYYDALKLQLSSMPPSLKNMVSNYVSRNTV